MQGGHGGAYTFDADPSDNAIQLMEMMSLSGTDGSLSGDTLHFDASKLLYMPTSADGQRDLPVETIATGDWNMSFKIDYDDLSVDLRHRRLALGRDAALRRQQAPLHAHERRRTEGPTG